MRVNCRCCRSPFSRVSRSAVTVASEIDAGVCWQEMWAEGQRTGWDFEGLYAQAYRLFDVMISTKEVLEDCFGHLSYRNKQDNRNPLQMSVERVFFHAALSPRWVDKAWPRIGLQPGDLRNPESLNFSRGKDMFLPSKHRSSETYTELKAIVDAGGSL